MKLIGHIFHVLPCSACGQTSDLTFRWFHHEIWGLNSNYLSSKIKGRGVQREGSGEWVGDHDEITVIFLSVTSVPSLVALSSLNLGRQVVASDVQTPNCEIFPISRLIWATNNF